jgi:hypothetical protein
MAKRYSLVFLVRGQEDLSFEVREKESERLDKVLSGSSAAEFFWFDSLDGRSVVINLTFVQAVRHLWDASRGASDSLRYEGGISIYLRGRPEPVQTYTESPDELFNLFYALESGAEFSRFPGFMDEDGEWFSLNPAELVWISAPTHLIEDGRRVVEAEGGDKQEQHDPPG